MRVKIRFMDTSEPSSSLSFSSNSHLLNNSAVAHGAAPVLPDCPVAHSATPILPGCEGAGPSLEVISLTKLSSNLEQLLSEPGFNYSDATIVVDSRSIGVHRCILGTRSEFFRDLFKQKKGSPDNEGHKPKYNIDDVLPYGRIGYDAFMIFLGYVYTGRLKASPVDVSTCVAEFCGHDSCRPAINFAVELMYASHIFCFPELVSLVQRQLVNFVSRAGTEDVIPVLNVAYDCQLTQLLTQCMDLVSRSNLDVVALEKELPLSIAKEIQLLRNNGEADDTLVVKKIKKIYKALDSNDVELMTMLLGESWEITLDQAYALHYAAAYCNPMVVSELLSLGSSDVNLRDYRGYTVLHVAAMRKDPKIIISLLSKGASAMELTPDGQSAASICRRLTRPKDYNAKAEQGQEVNKDQLCIDVLEREIRRNPLAGGDFFASPIAFDDLDTKLLNLEDRVAFAKLLFPAEAKLTMDIAHAGKTSEFVGLSQRKGTSGNLREVDSNETPIAQNKRLRSRMEALQRTVGMGRRYFPHCSEVLDKFMEDDLPDLCYLDKGTEGEQKIKVSRFIELMDDVQKAFSKDKAELNRSGLPLSTSLSSFRQNNHYRCSRKS